MHKQIIRFGIIGAGMMGREFASALARWPNLLGMEVEPQLVAVCNRSPQPLEWFGAAFPGLALSTDYRELLANRSVDAVYCAVPHHLHAPIYCDIIAAGVHLLGEKPFGIDQAANAQILAALTAHPAVFARCCSEFPYYPGVQEIVSFCRAGRFGRIIEVEAGLWHSSDLNPQKPINWKRQAEFNGEYGCLGDLGMHVLHLPLRFGWLPANLRAVLTKLFSQRPDGKGGLAACDTWDNAQLLCEVDSPTGPFPMQLSTKRIAPGQANTWFIRILGTAFSAEFSTKYPRTLRTLTFHPDQPQAWEVRDLGYVSAYPTITGGIFEFGFADAMLQMVAAYCDELVHGDQMTGPFALPTPAETALQHQVLTAALLSGRSGRAVRLDEVT